MKKLFYCLFFSCLSGSVFAQEVASKSGKVVSSKGEQLSGVVIAIKNTNTHTLTDSTGNFSISAKQGDTLVFSLIGFLPQPFLVGNDSFIDISMVEEVKILDEVEVIGLGYGSIKKEESTGAITLIRSEDLTMIGSPTPAQYLQGRVAGLQVIAENGEPGANMRLRVRGIGTVNNSDPLYVVDGFQTSDISFLAPKDVESMEVLKDASATAIYGSRGANGVILITTKKGQEGTPKFNFDTYYGVAEMWRTIDVNNAAQYAELKKEAYSNDKTTPNSSVNDALNAAIGSNQNGTNWQKEISRTGVIRNYNLSINGGGKISRWGLSGTLFNQDGTIKNSSVKKYFLRLTNDYTLSKWLNGGISANFSRTDKNFNNSNEYTGGLNNAVITDPITPVRNPDTGNWGYAFLSTAFNPARLNDLQKNNKNKNNNFTGSAYLEATIIKGLTFKSLVGSTYTTDLNTIYVPVYDVGPAERNNISTLFETRGQAFRWLWSNHLNYSKTIGRHSISAMIGAEAQATKYNSTSVSVTDVPENDLERYISASTSDPAANTITSNQGANALSSYFVRGNYGYKGKYLLTVTLRRDGSSKFAPKNRWGTFPAFGIGWNIAEENFMKSITFISILKLRSGWGKVGNQNSVTDYASYTLINGGNNYSFGGNQVPGFTIVNFGNSLLKWEQTETWNAGIDLEFWNRKMLFTSDYFIRNTKDMIIQLPTPAYAGANGAQTNVGRIENKGIEMALAYKSTTSYRLKYNVSVNFTHINNRVISVGDAPIKGGLLWSMGYTTMTDKGMPVGSFWGLQTDGIFHNQQEVDAYSVNGNKVQPNAHPGDVKFKDQNGDGKINEKDAVNLGSPLPKYTYGFTISLEYKGFDLNIYVMGVKGNKIVNGLNRFTQASTGQWNSTPNRLDAWTEDNPTSNEPRMTVSDPNQNMRFSDRYVQDGSYTRLQNLTLGYSLPDKLASKIRLTKLRFYLAADNLLTFTKYKGFDPEIGQTVGNINNPLNYGVDLGNYPQPRIFRAGMTIGF